MINQETMAAAYQPLFDLMSKTYGVTLLKSEMDDIINACDTVNENVSEMFRIKCDVKGCDETAATQGSYFKDTGYWCLCSKHTDMARRAVITFPEFKPEALEREKSRDSNGYLQNNYPL